MPGAGKEQKPGPLDAQVRELAAWSARQKEKGWKYSVDLSLDTSSGGTNEQVSRLASNVGRERPDTKTEFDVSYYRKVSDDELTDHKITVGYLHDWLDPESSWFWFVLARYDHDEFESWKQRANAQAGLAYHLIESDDQTLDIRLGLGARREWGSENDNAKAEGLIGADFRWKITDRQTCAFAPYFFPVVGDLDDYRARITGEWNFLFSKDMRLSFLVGTLYAYQSMVDPGKAHGDLRVYLGLRYGF